MKNIKLLIVRCKQPFQYQIQMEIPIETLNIRGKWIHFAETTCHTVGEYKSQSYMIEILTEVPSLNIFQSSMCTQISDHQFLINSQEIENKIGIITIDFQDFELRISQNPIALSQSDWHTLLEATRSLNLKLKQNQLLKQHHHFNLETFLLKLNALQSHFKCYFQNLKSFLKGTGGYASLDQIVITQETLHEFVKKPQIQYFYGDLIENDYNIEENRFLQYVLSSLLNYIQFYIDKIKNEILVNPSDIDLLMTMKSNEEELEALRQIKQSMLRQNENLKELEKYFDFFREIKHELDALGIYTPDQIAYTATLQISDFYRNIYENYLDLNAMFIENPSQNQKNKDMFIEEPTTDIEAWRLYELWVGLQIINELMNMPNFETNISEDWIDQFKLVYQSSHSSIFQRKNIPIKIKLKNRFLEIKIDFYCQYVEYLEGKNARKIIPDYALDFDILYLETKKHKKYSVVLDAKFKTYDFEKVLTDLKIMKDQKNYAHSDRLLFLLHPNLEIEQTAFQRYDDRPFSKRSLIGGEQIKSEKYGFFSLSPNNLQDFRLLLRWLLFIYPNDERPYKNALVCLECCEELTHTHSINANIHSKTTKFHCINHHLLQMIRCHQCKIPLYKSNSLWSIFGLEKTNQKTFSSLSIYCPACQSGLINPSSILHVID
jgi:hypothetical protein